jgi:hypothetical protein
MKSFPKLLMAACVLCLVALPLQADTINLVIPNTGMNVDANGVDLNYRMIQSADPRNGGPNAFVVTQLAPRWIGNGPNSKWIAPRKDESYAPGQAIGNESVGEYVYETHFTIPANANLSTVRVTGLVAADNEMNNLVLNGNRTGISTPIRGSGVEDLSYSNELMLFTITSGFVLGDNVVDVHILNLPDTTGPNPTGFQLAWRGTADTLAVVPEPGTLTLAGMALCGLVGYGWRRRR